MIGSLSIQFDQIDIMKLGDNQFNKDIYEYVKSDLQVDNSELLNK